MKRALVAVWGWLKNAFTKNMGMKIGALVFAFLLWSFVLAEENPPREKIFNDIPVTYANAEVLRQRGLTSAVPFSDVLSAVSVTVEANSDRLPLVTAETITAEADLSGITEPGEYTLPIKGGLLIGAATVVRVNPGEVTVNIEEVVEREEPVEVRVTGQKRQDLYYGDPVLLEDTVEITGARSNVERVAKAVCTIDIAGLDGPTKETRPVELLDENGNALDGGLFINIPSVILELPIYPKKDVPVDTADIAANTVGAAEGYEITDVSVTPGTVTVAGTQEALDSVTRVGLEPITLENASGNQIVDAGIVLPEGVYGVEPAAVRVQLTIAPVLEERTYPAVDIAVKNLAVNREAVLQPESVDLIVSGTTRQLDALTSAQLRPFVDLAGLAPGVHTVEIKFENAPDIGAEVAPAASAVQVTIG